MPDVATVGGDFSIFRLMLAFTVVLAMMAGLAYLLKYIAARGLTLPGSKVRARRMKIIETLPIDTKRRMVIIACDGHEHLLLLGTDGDIVVQSNLPPILPPK